VVAARDRDLIALDREGAQERVALDEVHDLPPGPSLRLDLLLLGDEAEALTRREDEPSVRAGDAEIQDLDAFVEVDLERERLAVAAPARQPVDAERVDAAVAGDDEELVAALRPQDEALAIALLVLDLGRVLDRALRNPDPAQA
jgi:hypothetical protein